MVEDGNDTFVFVYDFSVEPTYWHAPDEKIADTVIVKCLAGEQTCERAWLLERLNRLLATFDQEHNEAYARQYEPLRAASRHARELQRISSMPATSEPWCEVLVTAVVFMLALGAAYMALLTVIHAFENYSDLGFHWYIGAIIIMGILLGALPTLLSSWLCRLICPKS